MVRFIQLLSSCVASSFWSQLPIQMKLQSLCDMATVPPTRPLGVAEVPLCWNSLFSHCVCIPSAWLGRRFPGFGFLWLSILSSLSRLSKSLLSFQTKRTIILETISIAFCLSITQMCWKVLTLELYFMINPVCVCVWVVVKLCHAPDCSLCLCVRARMQCVCLC